MNFKRLIFATGLSMLSASLFAHNDNVLFDAMDDKSQFILTEKTENGITKYINKKGDEIKTHPIYKMSLEDRIKNGYTSVVKGKKINKNGSTVTFNVTFLDVVNQTGYGFDDATDGAARRATVEKAVEYYANIITNTGTADIEIQESENISGYALAWGGQYYFSTPGFQNGTMYRHITTGVDPSTTLADGLVTYNFYYTFNNDYSKNPTSTEYDLYTVSIHELGHAFGFTSMSNSDGSSQIASGVYSSYDAYLQSNDYSDLFTTIAGQNSAAMFASSSSELTTDGVVFDFGNGNYGAVYSPNPYNSSSLDHFDSSRLTDGGKYIMHPSLAKGVSVHEMHMDEAKVLEQIGYSIDFSTISTIIDGDHSTDNDTKISIYPNPANGRHSITVSIANATTQDVSLLVYDMLGNLIYKQSNTITSSTQRIELPIQNLVSSGAYVVQLQGNEMLLNQMLVIE